MSRSIPPIGQHVSSIAQCKNLGPKSAKQLASIGILTFSDLKHKGAIAVFVELAVKQQKMPSLNLLYALLGAIEDQHWTQYRSQKGELLIIIESQLEMRRALDNN